MKLKIVELFGLRISTMGLLDTVEWILNNRSGAKIYCCTLNEVMIAEENKNIKKILEKADILTPDGMPIVWLMKLKNRKGERVYGPDLMNKFLISNVKWQIKQVFIGDDKNKRYFDKSGKYIVLPFKNKFDEEDYKKMVEEIKKSDSRVVWVGLGEKKQIIVANELYKRLPDRVYVTVGAAFDFLSGNKKQAPRWVRNAGMEWLFRLVNEPNRLGKRYLMIFYFLIKMFCKKVANKVGDRDRLGKNFR